MQQREASRPRLIQALVDAFSLPDLRRRILFTLGALIIFRFIAHIPVPGVNPDALKTLFQQNQFLGMLDIFSGGAMRNFSIVAMGVYPYITASIIMQLLVPVIPSLQALSKEGESGRNKINLYTHWLTVPLACLQGYGELVLLRREGGIASSGDLATVTIIVSMGAGTMFLVWLGELIQERGIGNGVSMIIFAGILAGIPNMVNQGFIATNKMIALLAFALLGLATVVLIVIFTEAHRRIPVHYSRSVFRVLSSGPLKTLSYIAYRQPISQKRVIEVRGQHAYGHIKLLREMGLVAAERSGRSMSLRTTDYFADYFGLTQDTATMKKDLKRIFGEALKEEAQA